MKTESSSSSGMTKTNACERLDVGESENAIINVKVNKKEFNLTVYLSVPHRDIGNVQPETRS